MHIVYCTVYLAGLQRASSATRMLLLVVSMPSLSAGVLNVSS